MATTLKNVKNIVPLLDRILVQRLKAEAKTAAGVLLPEKSVERLSEGRVVSVGKGGLNQEGKQVAPHVAPGDRVLLPAYGGSNIKVGEEEFTLFRDHELLAVIKE
ncbi:hsp10-like protein [Schizosaccharomyces japonicus yFS275]|uniref:Hsp10-like protein n=1 Tax=Schizosaccharomyces japonicus (strain yFS275 / FY16936) TaxID=402676 RepID=B6JYM1_SCHJY|nr:hsp10-like protein [Schizosaccharomyces japonicus yFS275]EEB06639.1 hsp10-like protein [Schizosaccharomyces japonicus yFS275]